MAQQTAAVRTTDVVPNKGIKRDRARFAVWMVVIIVVIITIPLTVPLLFGYQFHYNTGISMEPNVVSGSVYYSKPTLHPLSRGNVVSAQDDDGQQILKRIIGLPGETVALKKGFLINGKLLDEPYVRWKNEGEKRWTVLVPAEHYLVAGDNRQATRLSKPTLVAWSETKRTTRPRPLLAKLFRRQEERKAREVQEGIEKDAEPPRSLLSEELANEKGEIVAIKLVDANFNRLDEFNISLEGNYSALSQESQLIAFMGGIQFVTFHASAVIFEPTGSGMTMINIPETDGLPDKGTILVYRPVGTKEQLEKATLIARNTPETLG